MRVRAWVSAPAAPSAAPTDRPSRVRGTRRSCTISAACEPSSCHSTRHTTGRARWLAPTHRLSRHIPARASTAPTSAAARARAERRPPRTGWAAFGVGTAAGAAAGVLARGGAEVAPVTLASTPRAEANPGTADPTPHPHNPPSGKDRFTCQRGTLAGFEPSRPAPPTYRSARSTLRVASTDISREMA
ncbi:hypothetical protein FAGKG844_200034 [Frankia sp. AgKG'84/4]